jgi:hypothetical protein
LVVQRMGFTVLAQALTDDGRCPSCRTVIPGFWSRKAAHPAAAASV